jgi:Flp pilus assembly protein TadG
MNMTVLRPTKRHRQDGVAIVEFALVLPLLLVIVMGIMDFGLYFYNDLLLTHAARDAARYASVGNQAAAEASIASAQGMLVSTSTPVVAVNLGSSGEEASVTLQATYHTLTPLPALVPGVGTDMAINATARMRRE